MNKIAFDKSLKVKKTDNSRPKNHSFDRSSFHNKPQALKPIVLPDSTIIDDCITTVDDKKSEDDTQIDEA
jgi:hypothetical protein